MLRRQKKEERSKNNMEIKFMRKHEGVKLPTRRQGDAGFDLYADSDWLKREHGGMIEIKPHETVMIPTGLSSIIEDGYYAQVFERGSTGVKGIKYSSGVIDSSYRGQWNIVLYNGNDVPVLLCEDSLIDKYSSIVKIYEKANMPTRNIILYSVSKALAQFVMLPVPKVDIVEVNEAEYKQNGTERGAGKLGSSGK